MAEILALLQNLAPLLEPTIFRQMSQVIFGMLVISGRITMLGLSRWTEKGGSYRTIQRFYHSGLSWKAIQWLFFRKRLLKPEDEHIIAGDEVVIGKAGKETHGLDRFFSGIQQRVILGLSFFAFSLVLELFVEVSQQVSGQDGRGGSQPAGGAPKAEAKKV